VAQNSARAKGGTRASAPGKKPASAASTPLREQFAIELLVDFHVHNAWIRAHVALGMQPPKRTGAAYVALKDPYIADKMQALRAEAQNRAGINVERTEREIARLAYVDISQFYDADGRLLALHLIPEDARRAIVSVETEELFEFEEGEDPETALQELDPIVRDLVAAAKKVDIIPTEIKGFLKALEVWQRPAKRDRRSKHLIGYVRKVKIADKRGALELAGRRDGIFKDKVVHEAGSSLEKIIAESYRAAT
jgi:hypothetical protein